jgi:ribosomal protein L37AE/L43A
MRHDPTCPLCGIEDIPIKRYNLGYRTCLTCGEHTAKEARKGWTVAPMPKSNYMLFTDLSLLKGLNSSHKGGLT